jgi:PAS domain S-box-containing protein
MGITLFLIGLAIFLLPFLFLRLIPKLQSLVKASAPAPLNLSIPTHNEAVLLVQDGGRITYMNERARELFNIWEEEPNLESLARRARPSDTFLALCASEGQARISLKGQFVEGTSYYAVNDPGNGVEGQKIMLVCLRRPEIMIDGSAPPAAETEGSEPAPGERPRGISNHAFTIFSELSQAMASSLELDDTLKTILESVERLIPSDFLEITIWEDEYQHLVPYRLVGMAGLDRRLEKGAERYRANEGYSGYLITHRQPVLVEDVNTFRQARPALDRQQYPFQSYLGVPLLLAGELVGTLELASLEKEGYSANDQDVLKLLSEQAAVAVNNALLYQQEQQRAVELSSLANLAQVASSIQDIQELYGQLTESIANLIHAKILGFLIYDENRRLLRGQIPFAGIGSNVIEWYQTTIEPGSRGEQIWQNGQVISTTNAPEDERLQALELHHLAQAAGVHNTVLVPLSSAGRMLGYLQAANKRDDSPFDKNDIRLLSIIAGQAAPIIENVTQMQVSRHRAQRAETLRRIASLTSSAATLDEILKFSILDVARLLKADSAALFLLDESRAELRVHRESAFGISPEMLNLLGRISIDDPQFQHTVTGTKQQLTSDDLQAETDIPTLYQPLVTEVGVRSMINIPLISRESEIGELMVASFKGNYFTQGDIQTIATSAGLLAAAVERARLYTQTDQSLRTRVEQLTALTRISRELNMTLDQEHLLKRVYDEALRTTYANCGTILIFELSAERQPEAGNGSSPKTPKIALRLGDEAAGELHPLEVSVLETGETLVVDDFKSAASGQGGRHDTGLYPAHEGIRSALIVPIAYQGQIAGLIHLHSKEANHFERAEREIGEALAVQAAIALGNAQRYREQVSRSELLNRRVETLSSLFETSQVLQKEQPLEQSLEAIAYAIQSSTPFEIVLISIYEKSEDCLKRLTGAGIPLYTLGQLKAQPQPWKAVEKLLQDKFQLGNSYFIPYEKLPESPADLHTLTLLPADSSRRAENQWHPEDLLFVPLFDASGEPLGLISVDAPRDNLRPDRPTIETLEIFATQTALVIENYQKLKGLKSRLEQIQAELALARESTANAQSHLPVLLHKDLEQTLTIQNLSQRSRRLNAGLDIATLVGRQASRSDVLLTLGHETLARMDFDAVLIAEEVSGDLRLNHILGVIPPEVNPKALLGQRNPLRHSLSSGELLLVSNLFEEGTGWQNTPLINALEAESFICVPIGKISIEPAQPDNQVAPAAMLATSRTPQAPFTEDDEQLYSLLVRQVAIALQNLTLLDETTRRLNEVNLLLDFSRQLGSLDPESILQTLVESALNVIPSAEAAMVALWDDGQSLLVPKAASGYADEAGLLKVLYHSGEGLPGQVFEQGQALRLDAVEFARHYNLSPDNLMRYRNATGGRLPVSSLAVPIIASRAGRQNGGDGNTAAQSDAPRAAPLGVLVLDNAEHTAAFSEDDLAVIASLAHQTALTLENARLYQASEQRSQQLQALTQVSTTLTSSLKTEELIATLLDQLQEILPYDTGTLWLREQGQLTARSANGKDKMIVRDARGFEDSHQRIGLSVDVQDSVLLNEMIQTGQPIWVTNILEDPRFRTVSFDLDGEETNPTPAAGYERLSWLGVPLIVAGNVIGVIALEKGEANFYSTDDIQVVTTFASQAAVGMENAQLYQESVQRAQELDKRSQTLAILNRLSSELSGSLDATRILEAGIREFHAVIPSDCVSALRFDYPKIGDANHQTLQVILQAEYPPVGNHVSPDAIGSSLPNTPLFIRLSETLGIFNTENVDQEPELGPLREFLEEHRTRALLVVPIVSGYAAESEITTEPHLHGLLLAHSQESRHYNVEELELARTISNQIAISLQNARLYEETRSLTEDLEERVQLRTAELEKEHLRSETLLRIITELSASLDLDQVLNSTLRVLGEYVDAEQITILNARPDEGTLYRLASVGYTPGPREEGEPTPFEIDQGLAGWIINQRQSVLVDDVLEDERWIEISYPQDEGESIKKHRSALGVPLMCGADALGALLLFHTSVGHFSIDQLDMVQAAGNQVAIAVNNAELYRLIRDQAEDLGSMLRSQQIETSRSNAILEAVADGVLVTDANRQITLFNESAETILGLERSQVRGRSLENFIGVFGREAQNWTETIRTWSQDPNAYEPGDTYAEQITLEDGRVISVHLAPVSLNNDFLGTVSIFQDITHQVEVDRLKSEFVATVSHELRTPMTSIKGYVEVLLMGAGGQLTEQQSNFLEVVKSNADRLEVLVNDLLDVSQIEAGKAVLALQPLSLEEPLEQAIADLNRRSQEEGKPIEIIKELQPGLQRVSGDPDRLRQILDNLLENAYQYNTPGGKIFVRVKQVVDMLQVDIQDLGLGIPTIDQEQVFERFYRGENPLVLGISGTGLGLAIVRNLVNMHNGQIWFESSGVPGEGSTFSFTLPIYDKAKKKEDENPSEG